MSSSMDVMLGKLNDLFLGVEQDGSSTCSCGKDKNVKMTTFSDKLDKNGMQSQSELYSIYVLVQCDNEKDSFPNIIWSKMTISCLKWDLGGFLR